MVGAIEFFRRDFPSANAVLLNGPRPVLVDTGFGADFELLDAWLRAKRVLPETIALIVNTHFDCDHAGGNHAFAARYGVPIATGAAEAAMVNAGDPETGRARWLHQPLEPYDVSRTLFEDDVIDTGAWQWRVIDTPGHTAGHISLFCRDAGVLVTGDAVHADDIGWLDLRRPSALDEAEATLDQLATLPVHTAYSGHGPPTTDPEAAFATAKRRLAAWRTAPDRMAWHGIKRVFAYGLMVENGLAEADVLPYLLACPWFHDYAAHPFGLRPHAFAEVLVTEMLRAQAAKWVGGTLVAGAPFTRPLPNWPTAPTDPALWLRTPRALRAGPASRSP